MRDESKMFIPHPSALILPKKEELNHAQGKTWKQAPRAAQEDLEAGERLPRHQIEALSLGKGVGRARVEFCIHRLEADVARRDKFGDGRRSKPGRSKTPG